MPIKTTLRNTEFFAKSMFNTGEPLNEDERDKTKDYIHKEIIQPEKPYQLDFETFEYLVEKMIKRRKLLAKEYKGILGDGLINFTSEVQSVEYVLFDILFPDWFREQLNEFADTGYIEYWEDDYFDKKYGELKEGEIGHSIKPDDYENSIKINNVKDLYDYLYESYEYNKESPTLEKKQEFLSKLNKWALDCGMDSLKISRIKVLIAQYPDIFNE